MFLNLVQDVKQYSNLSSIAIFVLPVRKRKEKKTSKTENRIIISAMFAVLLQPSTTEALDVLGVPQ